MPNPDDFLYTESHEWIEKDGDIRLVGITDHAQHQLGDIVFVDLPEVGQEVTQGEAMFDIESPKAAAEVNAPMSGTIEAVNEALSSAPETINGEPYGAGWMVKIRVSDAAEAKKLMNHDKYLETVEG